MATGASGASGTLVARHANRENNHEHVNVIHLLLNTAGRNAMDRQMKLRYVTKTSLAQVS